MNLIPSSTKYHDNFTEILKVTDTLQVNKIESGNILVSNGTIKGLDNPTIGSQAATYAYAGGGGGGTNPGGPIKSIQYNVSGDFQGSNSFTFDDTTNILMSNMKIGDIVIRDGTITGLETPTENDHAVNKGYISDKLEMITINDPGPQEYPLNKSQIIFRNTSVDVIDSLPSAVDIISSLNLSIGNSNSIKIQNTGTGTITLSLGENVVGNNTIIIYPGYQYNGILLAVNTDPGSEQVNIYSISNFAVNNRAFRNKYTTNTLDIDTIRISDFWLRYNDMNKLHLRLDSRSVSEVALRFSASSGSFSFDDPIFFYRTESIFDSEIYDAGMLWQTGGIDVFVVNNDEFEGGRSMTLYQHNTVISGIPWTWYPVTIPMGYTAWFILRVVVGDNYPKEEALLSANIDCVGIFPNGYDNIP